MTSLNYFGICLLVNAGGGHENAKLPVAQSGDEPGRLCHAHTISQFRFLALCLQREVYRLPVGVEPCAMIVLSPRRLGRRQRKCLITSVPVSYNGLEHSLCSPPRSAALRKPLRVRHITAPLNALIM